MTNLLFPTDFSANATNALNWARLFARKTGATITLLHVYQPLLPDTTLPTIGEPGLGVTASLEVERISKERLDQLALSLQHEGLSVLTDWRVGSVEDEILDAARQLPADLIVMGRSDLSTFFDRLAGSAVSDVADSAPCPVLIVPTPAEGEPIKPAQIRTVAYAVQSRTTRSDVMTQTDSIVDAFDAHRIYLTEDQLERPAADMVVLELYRQGGFLDSLLHPNRAAALIEKSDVPVLVFHQ